MTYYLPVSNESEMLAGLALFGMGSGYAKFETLYFVNPSGPRYLPVSEYPEDGLVAVTDLPQPSVATSEAPTAEDIDQAISVLTRLRNLL